MRGLQFIFNFEASSIQKLKIYDSFKLLICFGNIYPKKNTFILFKLIWFLIIKNITNFLLKNDILINYIIVNNKVLLYACNYVIKIQFNNLILFLL